MTLLRARLDDMRVAIMMLTRLPAGRSRFSGQATLARAVWAFPLIGAAVGLLAGLAYWLAILIHLPVSIAAVVALTVATVVTGGLHEDGLADFSDGIGGGRDPPHVLDIMRDSRIGSYGAIALILAYLLRYSAIVCLAASQSVVLAWVAAGAVSRTAMVCLVLILPPARADGLGIQIAAPPRWSIWGALLLAGVSSIAAMGLRAMMMAAAAFAATGGIYWLARKHVRGYTGDVLGACALSAECAIFIAAVAWWA